MTGPRFLVIRRDNIGDLVLTTPLVAGLRMRYPDAWIGVLANTYNAPVLEGNPDIDTVYAYRKAKHGETTRLGVAWERIRLVLALRRRALDTVVLATPAAQPRLVRLAKLFGAKRIVGFVPPGETVPGVASVPLTGAGGAGEAELVWRLAPLLDLHGEPPAARVVPSDAIVRAAREALAARVGSARGPVVGVHISARKPSQRWPIDRFAAFMRALSVEEGVCFMLFWAPGDAKNPTHPGDDRKAHELLALVPDLPVLPWPTHTLAGLIGGMAVCDRMVMSDGGAMHIAAALGKPIVAFFGKSDAARWRPWKTRYELLQTAEEDVEQVTVEAALEGYHRLFRSAL
jgi:heptosyltransferase-3